MDDMHRGGRLHPLWWAATLFITVIGLALLCTAIFAGAFRRYIPVTLMSERAGLVMEPGARVMMRGVEVGRVGGFAGGPGSVKLDLEIFPDRIDSIPSNVGAQIQATTAFGAKYVDLIYPDEPSPERLSEGEVLHSRNVATEVNTVFDNLVGLLNKIDVRKLNAVLAALADGVRGQGERMGQATADADEVLLALSPRMDTLAENWRSFKGFSDAYDAAAPDILSALDAVSAPSATVTDNVDALDALLLNSIGFATSGIDLLAPNKDNLVNGVNALEPTTSLLLKYSPTLTCLLQGAKYALDNGAYENLGGNGRATVQDAGLLFGDDPYRYPDNLPIVAAKGGPGGKPSCGSLPDVSKNFPVRYLVTDTGFGTGLDIRPNPGIGFPGWVNYFPVTKAVPEPPKIRYPGGPAPGPVPPYPGAPPYGAPLYGPGGVPLWPGIPPAPTPPEAAGSTESAPGQQRGEDSAPGPVEPPPSSEMPPLP